MECSGISKARASRKIKQQNRPAQQFPLRRAGTAKQPNYDPTSQRSDQPYEAEAQLSVPYPYETVRKRKSTFDSKFKGWRGPVNEELCSTRPSCSDFSPSYLSATSSVTLLEKTSSASASVSSSKDQKRPSTSSVVIDNNYYRSLIRRSITSARQVPRVPIVPGNVSVPNVDWDEVKRIDSRDSCVQRRSAFEWEVPDSRPNVHRRRRTRVNTQTSSACRASSSRVTSSQASQAAAGKPNTRSTREHHERGAASTSDVVLQRDENLRTSSLIREVIRMRAINSTLKEEIDDMKQRHSQLKQ